MKPCRFLLVGSSDLITGELAQMAEEHQLTAHIDVETDVYKLPEVLKKHSYDALIINLLSLGEMKQSYISQVKVAFSLPTIAVHAFEHEKLKQKLLDTYDHYLSLFHFQDELFTLSRQLVAVE